MSANLLINYFVIFVAYDLSIFGSILNGKTLIKNGLDDIGQQKLQFDFSIKIGICKKTRPNSTFGNKINLVTRLLIIVGNHQTKEYFKLFPIKRFTFFIINIAGIPKYNINISAFVKLFEYFLTVFYYKSVLFFKMIFGFVYGQAHFCAERLNNIIG